MAVDVGLVEGTIAATTPNGSAISMTLRSSMRRDDADGLHRPDEAVDLLASEQVLLDLVGDDAVAGFLVTARRASGSGLGVTAAPIASTMASICSWENSASGRRACLGAAGERARFVNRGEVAIGLGRGLRHAEGTERYDALASLTFGRIFRLRRAAAGMTWTDTSSPTRRAAGGAGVGRRLHGADVAAHQHR